MKLNQGNFKEKRKLSIHLERGERGYPENILFKLLPNLLEI